MEKAKEVMGTHLECGSQSVGSVMRSHDWIVICKVSLAVLYRRNSGARIRYYRIWTLGDSSGRPRLQSLSWWGNRPNSTVRRG